MRLKNYIYPKLVIKSIKDSIMELIYYNRYKNIIDDLHDSGRLKSIGIVKQNNTMLIGVDLNPELLIYADDAQESVELKMVSEKMKKYTNFLQKEGILDSIKAEHERVKSDEYYGYVVAISFNFRKYKRSKLIYDIIYSVLGISLLIFLAYYGLTYIL